MHRFFTFIAAIGALLLFAPRADACGGGFGLDIEVEPTQTIILSHRDGVESYVLSPRFCGPSGDFGLIVPIPKSLVEDPRLVDDALQNDLEALIEPRHEIVEECEDQATGAGASSFGGTASGGAGGIAIIDQGSVGIFDWTELSATSSSAFTDWLDARQFPYEAESIAAFDHYVQAGWQFVAFEVSPEHVPGSTVCGDLGPIRITFSADEPVVPSRIAVSHDHARGVTFLWQIFLVADQRVSLTGATDAADAGSWLSRQGEYAYLLNYGVLAETTFAGPLTAEHFSDYPSLGDLASEGEWLTSMLVAFEGSVIDDDFRFAATADQSEFQRVEYETVYVPCDADGNPVGGAGGTSGGTNGAASGSDSSGGCGCRVPQRHTRWGDLGAVLFAACLVGARVRRRRTAR